MPKYFIPGVYVEETSIRAYTIEGVSTSTTGFIGTAKFGPVRGEPELLTSYSDFEHIYGGLDCLEYGGAPMDNYLAHAARAFFEEGGTRLYVSRVYENTGRGDGRATASIPSTGSPTDTIMLRARHPGAIANQVPVTFTLKVGKNALGSAPVDPSLAISKDRVPILRGVGEYDVVLLENTSSPMPSLGIYWLQCTGDEGGRRNFALRRSSDTNPQDDDEALLSNEIAVNETDDYCIRRVTVTVTLEPPATAGMSKKTSRSAEVLVGTDATAGWTSTTSGTSAAPTTRTSALSTEVFKVAVSCTEADC